jgi:hypothetical protein
VPLASAHVQGLRRCLHCTVTVLIVVGKVWRVSMHTRKRNIIRLQLPADGTIRCIGELNGSTTAAQYAEQYADTRRNSTHMPQDYNPLHCNSNSRGGSLYCTVYVLSTTVLPTTAQRDARHQWRQVTQGIPRLHKLYYNCTARTLAQLVKCSASVAATHLSHMNTQPSSLALMT